MSDLSLTIRLRPTRIGFLVRPNDGQSVRAIMRSCACLWGGVFNPIIPVFRKPPKAWAGILGRARGADEAKSYVNFFEPDVFVEAEKGLLEHAGFGGLRDTQRFESPVMTLDQFLSPERDKDWSEPAYGLNALDLFRDIYERELRFQRKQEKPALLATAERGSLISEAIFGVFPTQAHAAYIGKAYKDAFGPKVDKPTSQLWREAFIKGSETPLTLIRRHLELRRYWHHELVVHVFDPSVSTDVIDVWNQRLLPSPVLPIPIGWVDALEDDLRKILKSQHRPIRGNPSNLMHHPLVQFGTSVDGKDSEAIVKRLSNELPPGCFHYRPTPNCVWLQRPNDYIYQDSRLEVTAEEKRTTVEVKEDRHLYAQFEALAPEFASRFGGHHYRWVNAVRASQYLSSSRIAIALPFNTFDRDWPWLGLGGERVPVGREGWIYAQRFKNMTQHMALLSMEDAIKGTLKKLGIVAEQSEPGHIAKQMLEHLGGIWGAHLLADLETLKLLNKMAGGVRRRKVGTDIVEETFELRSAPVKDWSDLVARRKEQRGLPRLDLSDFTERKLIRLGLETKCPNCQMTNWHNLSSVDYDVVCERCLKSYAFPQAGLSEHNRNWHYRVVGPFSVPDYGRGSYSVLLSLRVIDELGRSTATMTFTTALLVKGDGVDGEVDFVALQSRERDDNDSPPQLIFGEAKSLGEGELIKSKDLRTLKALGARAPGAILFVSVLRDRFTDSEKKLLRRFVNWGRRPDRDGRATNPVVLLTGNELFFDHMVSATWKDLGEPFAKFADFDHTRNLHNFAEATQILHLGMEPFHEFRRRQFDKRRKKAPAVTG